MLEVWRHHCNFIYIIFFHNSLPGTVCLYKIDNQVLVNGSYERGASFWKVEAERARHCHTRLETKDPDTEKELKKNENETNKTQTSKQSSNAGSTQGHSR